MGDTFRCYRVTKDAAGKVEGAVVEEPLSSLPPGDVLLKVQFSALNYKDALAATGHPGVVRGFPHVPGIDAVGAVVESSAPAITEGDDVLVTSYDLGAGRWGGWAEYIRVPAEWVIPLPRGLSPREAIILGTAGLTAGMSVETLEAHGVKPDSGDVVVTGASGGVGCLSVMLLAAHGYQVTAVSGKAAWRERLLELGAAKVLDREQVHDSSEKPLLPARWAGAVDTVGGRTLATLLRQTNSSGCVAACGLVGGADIPLTVYPFLLRGVTLAGIDSAYCPRPRRLALWNKLGGPWKLEGLGAISTTVNLDEVGEQVMRILCGQVSGRVILAM